MLEPVMPHGVSAYIHSYFKYPMGSSENYYHSQSTPTCSPIPCHAQSIFPQDVRALFEKLVPTFLLEVRPVDIYSNRTLAFHLYLYLRFQNL